MDLWFHTVQHPVSGRQCTMRTFNTSALALRKLCCVRAWISLVVIKCVLELPTDRWRFCDDRWSLTSLWQVCRDFMVGRCFRTNCRYLHSMEAKNAEVTVSSGPSSDICKDFLNGKCNRPVCRFYHPPSSTPGGEPAAAMSSVPESNVCIARKNAVLIWALRSQLYLHQHTVHIFILTVFWVTQ